MYRSSDLVITDVVREVVCDVVCDVVDDGVIGGEGCCKVKWLILRCFHS